jgi:hypothetical protein
MTFHKRLHTHRTLEKERVVLNRKATTCGASYDPEPEELRCMSCAYRRSSGETKLRLHSHRVCGLPTRR